jgi:hypothetical protein
MTTTSLIIDLCWLAWALYWVAMAFATKRTIERRGFFGYRLVALAVVIASILAGKLVHVSPHAQLWPASLALGVVSDCLKPDRVEQRNGERRQLSRSQLIRREPFDRDRLLAVRAWIAVEHVGIEHRRDVADKVAVGVGEAKLRPAHHRADAVDLQHHAGLLRRLTNSCLERRLVRLDRPADRLPLTGLRLAHQQQPPLLIPGEHRNRRQQQQLVADLFAQMTQIRRDAHCSERTSCGPRVNAKHVSLATNSRNVSILSDLREALSVK